jgi:GT2 family glycosyltransferase
VRYPPDRAFNYQVAVNLGAGHAGGAHVLFLNDDVMPLADEWLTAMVELLTLPNVGIVGALLRHADGRIQHAGVKIGENFGHLYHDAPADTRGHRLELLVPGNPEAVTGACMLVRNEVLEQVSGYDERYVQVYGDVDFCYRVTSEGWRVAWSPAAVLEHLESATYAASYEEADVERFVGAYVRDRPFDTSHTVWA